MRSLLFDSAVGPLVVGLAVGCLMLVATLVALAKPRGAWLKSRLEPYGGVSGAVAADGPTGTASRAGWRPHVDRLYGATERAFDRTSAWRSLERLIERAHLQVRPAQFLFWVAAAGVGLAVLVSLLTTSLLLVTAAFVGGLVAPFAWVASKGRRRLRAFEDQLPDVLMTMAGSLKVGQSFDHSMRAIVDEGMAPASEEFGRVINETRLGRPLDEALGAMADRIDSDDFRFVLMSVTIQREIGGSLANLFQTVSDTVRSRQQFRRKVHALTAMGRASAYVLVGLPLVTAGLISVFNPSYLTPLVHQPAGQLMLVAVFAMMAIGALVLKKIVSIKG
jgi:tight adherence protein B